MYSQWTPWEFQTGLAPLVGMPLDLSKKTWSGVEEKHLPFGAIIAVVTLVNCIPTDDLTQKQIGRDRPFGDFSLGRYGWIFDEEVKMFTEPIPAKGHQCLWNWEPPAHLYEGGISLAIKPGIKNQANSDGNAWLTWNGERALMKHKVT